MGTENLLEKILAAPVGKVVDVLAEILNSDIKLLTIEQNTVSPHKFERKVTISSDELPVIKAQVQFDSTILPKNILDELLKKKQGIGSILTQNKINAIRKVISLNHNPGQSKATREYEILVDGTVWFTILEEIRLENLGANQNS
jgi:chorismate-pyruvate lyase